jgi:pimeloyl-ACP methyl ester carboxylesterase
MEKNIKIKASDGKTIYGILRGPLSRPVIILVHGLAGHMNEALHHNAAAYFEKRGFSSFRFGLYSWQKGARKLHECTFSTHGKDIDNVIKYLESHGAKRIFIAGHSYGFPSILHTGHRTFRAVAAWDGSLLPKNHIDVPLHSKNPKGRIIDEGYFVIVGEQMAKDSHRISSLKLLESFEQPILFVTVDSNTEGNLSGATKMYKSFKGKKELVVIKGATHNFTEEGKEEKLYAATIKWFKKYECGR